MAAMRAAAGGNEVSFSADTRTGRSTRDSDGKSSSSEAQPFQKPMLASQKSALQLQRRRQQARGSVFYGLINSVMGAYTKAQADHTNILSPDGYLRIGGSVVNSLPSHRRLMQEREEDAALQRLASMSVGMQEHKFSHAKEDVAGNTQAINTSMGVARKVGKVFYQ